ncbi:MAG: 50S ribosomal protein L2 [Candidatus Magasanikbacteria bacterium GW2011_GWC2_34_16]|uniref:Large ribosomal subunit protein uL2 n=2 Tax=Candidatus Magasanikiibacteriota TaxID=1752731 RepID=A0A0G0HL42_9BACT|nr:MAG: 50S ribosomal protein L2 [Candidatus Magasanikbacteria bacterium GW2011_GWC2_34_16]KKQ39285.1 MAG: 50S ribosomal protein L2 [Candidatus Magasanikbacteria bacterium GW2011_GWA2_37_8]
MPIKVYKPTIASRRKSSVDAFSDITKFEPEKSLIKKIQKKSGRNNQGRITVRHQGGGVKQFYRLVDFKQPNYDMEATVLAIEYDPNRGPRIALIEHTDGVKAYILCPADLNVGDKVMSSMQKIEAKVGNRMPLKDIPVGLFIYNIELTPGKGGQLVRGAGLSAQLAGMEGNYAQVRLPSGEIRGILKECTASVGVMGNPDRRLIRWGKAGRMRLRGIKPTVKGKNMNPVDHPHGGGEGHNPIGQKRGPQTIYGKTAMGVRTRTPGKWSNKFIIKPRKGKLR